MKKYIFFAYISKYDADVFTLSDWVGVLKIKKKTEKLISHVLLVDILIGVLLLLLIIFRVCGFDDAL